ncbi:MAG: hypothetical protein LBH19_11540, partial [Dysgonamonadaceae bacterium]|nr:hypothetical protein [Dysgonamonadaceae bacterium]
DQIFDFNNIPGWKWGEPKYYSNVAEWGNNDVKKYGSYLNNKLQQSSWSHFTDTSIDGDYVMCVSHYSRQVWQQLQEKVHNNVRYTVTVNAGMNQWANPAPNGANHYVRIQLAIFNDAVGDLNNITVLKEECIPLTAEDKGVFNQKQLIYDAPALSPHFGKQMIITLSGYQESDPLPGNAIIKWTDQNYFFDMLQITRQKISQ